MLKNAFGGVQNRGNGSATASASCAWPSWRIGAAQHFNQSLRAERNGHCGRGGPGRGEPAGLRARGVTGRNCVADQIEHRHQGQARRRRRSGVPNEISCRRGQPLHSAHHVVARGSPERRGGHGRPAKQPAGMANSSSKRRGSIERLALPGTGESFAVTSRLAVRRPCRLDAERVTEGSRRASDRRPRVCAALKHKFGAGVLRAGPTLDGAGGGNRQPGVGNKAGD